MRESKPVVCRAISLPQQSLPVDFIGDSYAYALLYGKFRMHAEKMKNLMTDIERRCDNGPE